MEQLLRPGREETVCGFVFVLCRSVLTSASGTTDAWMFTHRLCAGSTVSCPRSKGALDLWRITGLASVFVSVFVAVFSCFGEAVMQEQRVGVYTQECCRLSCQLQFQVHGSACWGLFTACEGGGGSGMRFLTSVGFFFGADLCSCLLF